VDCSEQDNQSVMGSILADLTTEIIRATKKKSKKWSKKRKLEKKQATQQTDDQSCISCATKADHYLELEDNLRNHQHEKEKLGQILQTESFDDMMLVLEKMKTGTNKLKESEENKMLDDIETKLKERDTAHSERIKSLELLMNEKEKQLLESSSTLKGQLEDAMNEKVDLTNQLSQLNTNNEVDNLQKMIDVKREEVNQLKAANNSLRLEMERLGVVEVQLQVEKQRSEEMTEVISMKNDQLRQVLDQYDEIQHQLDIEVAAHLACQQELEKIQWEKENFLNNTVNVSSVIGSKNWKNLANRKESLVIKDVVQKDQGVAYSFNC